MKNILQAIKSCLNGLRVYVDEMMRKATESKPDWTQNDPTAPDYVKNRPFWTGDPVDTVLFEGTVVNDDAPGIELIVGQEYTVTLDGVEYVLTAWDGGDGSVALGSESVWWGNEYVDTEPPFALGVWDGGTWFYTINEGEEHTLKVVADIAEVHKIDEKYLPGQTLYDNRTMLVDFGGEYGSFIDVIDNEDGQAVFYYLTPDTFTVEELVGKRMDLIEYGERFSSLITADQIEDIKGDGTLFSLLDRIVTICNTENTVLDNVTFPYKGVYVLHTAVYGHDYAVQIYDGSYKQLDRKYLPDSLGFIERQIPIIDGTANDAKTTADDAKTTADNAPKFIDSTWNITIAPTKTTPLTVGSSCSITSDHFQSIEHYLNTLPLGSRMELSCLYVYDAAGSSASANLIVEKTSVDLFKGGFWAAAHLPSPQYFFVLLRKDSSSSDYYRYV